jgi:hypothetical protein
MKMKLGKKKNMVKLKIIMFICLLFYSLKTFLMVA